MCHGLCHVGRALPIGLARCHPCLVPGAQLRSARGALAMETRFLGDCGPMAQFSSLLGTLSGQQRIPLDLGDLGRLGQGSASQVLKGVLGCWSQDRVQENGTTMEGKKTELTAEDPSRQEKGE